MTPTDAARQLLTLAEQATPGPWEWVIPDGIDDLGYEGPMPKIKANNCEVCDFGDNTAYYPTQGSEPSDADQKLIVHTRNHGPAIARALLDATERIAELEAALRQIRLTADLGNGQHPALDAIYEMADVTLTPEGGGK